MEEAGKKIEIEICLGTTCFVMGASKLQELETLIPPKYRSLVEVKANTCMDLCKNATYMKAPFVKVDGELITEANVEKVLNVLERKING